MAAITELTYNSYDKIYYGTEAMKDADTVHVLVPTTKVYCYDTGTLYVSDGETYQEVS